METGALLYLLCVMGSLVVPSTGFPSRDKAVTRNEEIKIEGRMREEPSHLLQMEHREEAQPGKFNQVMDKVLGSRTVSAVDKLASNVIQLAGGVVVDLGDFFVDTIDQLPETIRIVSDAVGKAVDSKREQVRVLVKGEPLEEPVKMAVQATEKIGSAVQKSEFQSSLGRLEDAFASFVGKFIGVTYKNAEGIGSAFSNGIKRITTPTDPPKDDLPVLSRSLKDNQIADTDSDGH